MKSESRRRRNIFRQLPLTAYAVLKNVGHSIIIADTNGTIFFWNTASEQIFGYSSQEVEGKNMAMLHADDENLFNGIYSMAANEVRTRRWHGLHKDGSKIWIKTEIKVISDENGDPLVIIGTSSNIEKRKELETDLEESRARAQAIIDHTVDAIITINQQGIIQSFNKAAERIFGYKEAEVLGQNVNMLMPSPHRENHDQYLDNYYKTGVKKIIGTGREEQGRRKDGSIFPMVLSVSEVCWAGNKLYIGMIRDITKRRRLENQILEASEDERRRIGQDLHDGLGQMLTGIGLISRNIANKLEAKGAEGAEDVHRVADLVKEADEYARSLSHSLVPIDVDEEGMRYAFSQLASRAQKLFNILCQFEMKGKIQVKKGNISLHLYRITQEAISNAVKHGAADTIKISLVGQDHAIELTIEDNGVGFLEKPDSEKKEGLGIHTMQYRAHILGGNFTIDKNTRGWTRVRCLIPHYHYQL